MELWFHIRLSNKSYVPDMTWYARECAEPKAVASRYECDRT